MLSREDFGSLVAALDLEFTKGFSDWLRLLFLLKLRAAPDDTGEDLVAYLMRERQDQMNVILAAAFENAEQSLKKHLPRRSDEEVGAMASAVLEGYARGIVTDVLEQQRARTGVREQLEIRL